MSRRLCRPGSGRIFLPLPLKGTYHRCGEVPHGACVVRSERSDSEKTYPLRGRSGLAQAPSPGRLPLIGGHGVGLLARPHACVKSQVLLQSLCHARRVRRERLITEDIFAPRRILGLAAGGIRPSSLLFMEIQRRFAPSSAPGLLPAAAGCPSPKPTPLPIAHGCHMQKIVFSGQALRACDGVRTL